MWITLKDLTYTFESPTTFLLKQILVLSTEDKTVFPVINDYNLISVRTNIESDIYLEPLTTHLITMTISGFHEEVPIDSVKLFIEII
jgi:hypothetical protein